jgi:hypothetical protein
MAQPTIQTRLCPHCANTIAADALKCHYCKADIDAVPQWPEREDPLTEPRPRTDRPHLTVRSKVILVLGLLLFALGVFLVGGQQERSDLGPALAKSKQESLEKDEKIKSLEAQLAALREQAQGGTGEIEQLKTKLAARQKELAAAQKRLAEATREISRLSASRAAPPRPAARAADPLPPRAPASRAVEAGVYETVRPTTVFEQPATSSRILSRISKGTQVTAVRSAGDWLEIRSKHGNPPGYIRADDATLIGRGN